MTRITEDAIDSINHRIQHMDEDQIGKVWDEFAKEQPALVGYVLGESRELKVADARISYGAKGALADANRPGLLSRFFNWFPFF